MAAAEVLRSQTPHFRVRTPHHAHFRSPTPPCQAVAKETQIGNDTVVAPDMATKLQQFYDKVNSADQQQCRQIMRSLNSAKGKVRAQGRPKTACAVLGSGHLQKVLDPYTTTHQLDWEIRQASATVAERPMTAMPFSAPHDLSAPLGSSQYDNEYGQKRFNVNRLFTAKDCRNNNPHPSQAFMMWKLARKGAREQPDNAWAENTTSEDIDRALRGQMRSTYQSDYHGAPQGFDIRTAFRVGEDWRSKVPYDRDTMQRKQYDGAKQHPQLTNKTDRYGSNGGKRVVAKGIVPHVPRRNFHLNSRPTYVREYCDKVPGAAPAAVDGSQMARFLAQPASYEKSSLEGMYLAMQDKADTRPRSRIPAATPTYCYIPSPPASG